MEDFVANCSHDDGVEVLGSGDVMKKAPFWELYFVLLLIFLCCISQFRMFRFWRTSHLEKQDFLQIAGMLSGIIQEVRWAI